MVTRSPAVPDTDAQRAAADMIAELVARDIETGLQAAAFLDGELVVHAWGGVADTETRRPVGPDTLFPSWSSGKGVTATAVHVLAAQAVLDYDDEIATYWPEFAAGGKEHATVRDALTHAVGIPNAPPGLVDRDQLGDHEAIAAMVAAMRAEWEPGTASGYHAFTYGWIVDELVRRASGRTLADVLATDVAGRLGVGDSLFCAVPVGELHRVARLCGGIGSVPADAVPVLACWGGPAMAPGPELFNDPRVLTASVPAAGTLSAVALARMYAATTGAVDGVRLLSAERLAVATADQGLIDRTTGEPSTLRLGYAALGSGRRPSPFGFGGLGGSVGYVDPDYRFAFALTKNRMYHFDAPAVVAAEAVSVAVRRALAIGE